MVVSSACMITARITQAVIKPRLATLSTGLAAPAEEVGQEIRQAARMAGVDVDADAHADPERRLALHVFDADAHRNALDDLHPVAGGVLRRKQREARTRGRADAVDDALP